MNGARPTAPLYPPRLRCAHRPCKCAQHRRFDDRRPLPAVRKRPPARHGAQRFAALPSAQTGERTHMRTRTINAGWPLAAGLCPGGDVTGTGTWGTTPKQVGRIPGRAERRQIETCRQSHRCRRRADSYRTTYQERAWRQVHNPRKNSPSKHCDCGAQEASQSPPSAVDVFHALRARSVGAVGEARVEDKIGGRRH